MTDELNKFAGFYGEKYKGRKLDWDHALGHATLRAHFKAGPKELTVSLYQAVILLLFNEVQELHFRDIKSQTSMGASSFNSKVDVCADGHYPQRTESCGGRCRAWHSARSVY